MELVAAKEEQEMEEVKEAEELQAWEGSAWF